jgi:pimeloyl-ACP methyl ester carboxylesterase
MREAMKIAGGVTLAAILYGVAQDQVTARVSLEYFTQAHAPFVASHSPTVVGAAWGARAAAPVGLVLGLALALAARAGPPPRRDARSLRRGISAVVLGAAATAIVAGALAFHAARSEALRLEVPIPLDPGRQARFAAVYAATLAAYASGTLGGIALCVATWRRRRRERTGAPARGRPLEARVGALLYYGSLAALAVMLLAPLAAAWWITGLMMRPPWYAHPGPQGVLAAGGLRDPQRDFGLAFEEVAFPTARGATLRGWWIPARDADVAVVLAGGGWSDRRSLLPLAPALHAAGLPVLAFDYREHGRSDGSGRGSSYGLRESRDVRAAVDWLSARGVERIGVVGYSVGGAAAILAAADDPRVDAVVASTPGTTLDALFEGYRTRAGVPAWFGRLLARVLLLRAGAPAGDVLSLAVGPLSQVDRIAPRPLLVLVGADDPVNPIAEARRLFARAGEPKELVVVAGAAHLEVLDAAGGEAVEILVAFLERSLSRAP